MFAEGGKMLGKHKMVCLDIDGTLLNSNHMITKATKEVICRITKQQGILVVLVSARMPQGIVCLQKELGTSGPIICYNGAVIWEQGRAIRDITIPTPRAKQVYALCQQFGLHLSLYKDDTWYVSKPDFWAKQESNITNINWTPKEFEELFSRWLRQKTGPNKLLCMAEEEKIELLSQSLEFSRKELNVYPSKTTYLEIMPAQATKTNAIAYLCWRVGVKRHEIIAIGDNYNDIDMLEFADLGVAMGNAPMPVKRVADFVTKTNDEDGVAWALEELLT